MITNQSKIMNKEAKEWARMQLSKLESKKITTINNLDRNLNALCKAINLNKTEHKILEFAICMNEFKIMCVGYRNFDDLHVMVFYEALAHILASRLARLKRHFCKLLIYQHQIFYA